MVLMSNGAGDQKKDSISSTIDRLITASSSSNQHTDNGHHQQAFIAAKKWRGPKLGYYFGTTTEHGTGYYLDAHQQHSQHSQENGISTNRKRPRPSDNGNDNDGAGGNKQSKSVRFGQDSIQTIPSRHDDQNRGDIKSSNDNVTKSAEELLKEAEENLASQPFQPKTLSNLTTANKNSNNNIKSILTTLKNTIQKNQMQRAQHPTKPQLFMESEVSLFEEIRQYKDLALSTSINPYYHQFVSYGGVDCLINDVLNVHENVDLILEVVSLFVELLDPSLLVLDSDVNGEDEGEKMSLFMGQMAFAFIGSTMFLNTDDAHLIPHHNGSETNGGGGLEMCIANLKRFADNNQDDNNDIDDEEGEGEDTPHKGIEDVLTLVENLLDLDRMGVFQLVVNNYNAANDDNDDEDDEDRKESATTTPRYKYKSIASILFNSTSFVSYLLTNLEEQQQKHQQQQKSSKRQQQKQQIMEQDDEGWSMSLRLHAAEVLASLLQHEDSKLHLTNISTLTPYTSIFDDDDENSNNNEGNAKKKKKEKKKELVDGMEILLQSIAVYRKTDPKTEEECEYIENIFDTLAASLLHSSSNTGSSNSFDAFLECQGIELMLRCMNEKVHSGSGAMKVLFFAMTSSTSSSSSSSSTSQQQRACETFVEAGGLKLLFPIFMGRKSSMPKPASCCDAGNITVLKKYAEYKRQQSKNSSAKKKPSKHMKRVVAASKEWFQNLESQSIQIIYALTRYLTDASPNDAKSRLLGKFLESDCAKCDRLVELCLKYDKKMRQAEYQYYKSDEAEEAEESGVVDVDLAALNAKLKGGGDLFHRVGALISFAAVGSKRCHEYILEQLRTQNSGIGVAKAALEEFANILDDGDQKDQLHKYLDSI